MVRDKVPKKNQFSEHTLQMTLLHRCHCRCCGRVILAVGGQVEGVGPGWVPSLTLLVWGGVGAGVSSHLRHSQP